MNSYHSLGPKRGHWTVRTVLAGQLLLGLCLTASAFPPAPYYLIYGLVRDRYGNPLTSSSAQILLQTPTGAVVASPLVPGYAAGINYQMKVPMDAGETPDLYA